MKINKDDELIATPAEFMIMDKIRKDQRAEFYKDLEEALKTFTPFDIRDDIRVLLTKYQK